jgi:hypothetical protein
MIIAALALAGCKVFTPPQGHPVLDDRIAGNSGKPAYVQFATTPERRVVLMAVSGTADHVCAEPSPDAAENLSYSLSAALAAKKTGSGEVDASVASALQSAAQQIFTRTQGIQFYRDGMFSLCLALMNGAIDAKQYFDVSQDLRDKSAQLIHEEIPYIAGIAQQKKSPTPSQSVAPSTPDSTQAPASPVAPTNPTPPAAPTNPMAPATAPSKGTN